MNGIFYSLLITTGIIVFGTSCNQKCYDCSRDCGTCTKGFINVFGCEGDSALSGFSVQSWKFYLEGQGYSCNVEKVTETDVCSSEDRKELQAKKYSCRVQ